MGGVMLMSVTIMSSYTGVHVPYFGIGPTEFLASFYIMFGHYYRTRDLHWEKNLWFNLLSLLFIAVGVRYWYTSMTGCKYWQFIPYALSSIGGTLVIFNISHWLEKYPKMKIVSILTYTGGYTFNVLTWHFISFKVVSLLLIVIYVLSIDQLECFPTIVEYALDGWWLVYTVAGVGIPIVWTYYFHRLKSVYFSKSKNEKVQTKIA